MSKKHRKTKKKLRKTNKNAAVGSFLAFYSAIRLSTMSGASDVQTSQPNPNRFMFSQNG